MHVLHLLSVSVQGRSLNGLPEDWAPVFVTRLRAHAHAKYLAIVAPKGSIPKNAGPADIPEAHVVLFLNRESVLDVCIADSCRLSGKGGGIAKFDKGKIMILFETGVAFFDTTLISRDEILFSL